MNGQYDSFKYLIERKEVLRDIFLSEGRLLRIPENSSTLCILGDIHGDYRVLSNILNRLDLGSGKVTLVCLGDYFDHFPNSWQEKRAAVINELLSLKLNFPEFVYLLMGNHEADPSAYVPFYSEFWSHLNPTEKNFYSDVLSCLPIVATTANGTVSMCHASIPLSPVDFDSFDLQKTYWQDVIWSDLVEELDNKLYFRRPIRTKDFFLESISNFQTNLLVRGHTPSSPLKLFNNRAISIQTNRYYADICGMHVVIIEQGKYVKDANDVAIKKISIN